MNTGLAQILPLSASTRKEIDPHHLEHVLKAQSIPLSQWGIPPAKSVDDLKRSMRFEDVRLVSENGKLTLHVRVAVLFVRNSLNGYIEELQEAERLFPGNIRLPGRSFNGTLAETFEKNETSLQCAIRGLDEELGFKDQSKYVIKDLLPIQKLGPILSPDHYPGLPVLYERNKFVCLISKELHRSEYIEKRGERTTIFRWKML
jgi:hypothetical protein